MPAPANGMLFIIQPPEPLPESPAYVGEFYGVIGRLVLTWGRLEQHVDNLERMAINIEARSAPERQMIVSLERKLETIKGIAPHLRLTTTQFGSSCTTLAYLVVIAT